MPPCELQWCSCEHCNSATACTSDKCVIPNMTGYQTACSGTKGSITTVISLHSNNQLLKWRFIAWVQSLIRGNANKSPGSAICTLCSLMSQGLSPTTAKGYLKSHWLILKVISFRWQYSPYRNKCPWISVNVHLWSLLYHNVRWHINTKTIYKPCQTTTHAQLHSTPLVCGLHWVP